MFKPYIAIQSLVPLKQIPTAVAIVLFTQNLGGAVWVVVANAIFNNSLRKQLSQRVSQIGRDPEVIIQSGARGVWNLNLSPTQLAAVLESYGKGVDDAMYLGIAVSVIMLVFAWGLGFKNIHKIKKLKELTDDNNKKEEQSTSEGEDAEKTTSA